MAAIAAGSGAGVAAGAAADWSPARRDEQIIDAGGAVGVEDCGNLLYLQVSLRQGVPDKNQS